MSNSLYKIILGLIATIILACLQILFTYIRLNGGAEGKTPQVDSKPNIMATGASNNIIYATSDLKDSDEANKEKNIVDSKDIINQKKDDIVISKTYQDSMREFMSRKPPKNPAGLTSSNDSSSQKDQTIRT